MPFEDKSVCPITFVQVHPQSSQRGKIFHPERKKRKIEKRKRKGTPFSFQQELCVMHGSCFFAFFSMKKQTGKTSKKRRERAEEK